jgi:Glyoxalase-like domain
VCDRGFFFLVFAVRIDLTLNCANATRLAEFWKLALGYQDEPTPAPFAARQEWLQQVDPGAGADDGAWLCDPEGVGPRLSLLRVPEPKVPSTGSTWTCGWPARPRCSRFPATM